MRALLLLAFILSLSVATIANSAPKCGYKKTKIKKVYHTPEDSFLIFDVLGLSQEELYAQKLFLRLTGTAMPLNHPRFRAVVQMVKQSQHLLAARAVTEEPNFLQVRVRNFAAPFTNKDMATTEPLNDLQALIIGITRDELDARQILNGNISYEGYPSLGLPFVSKSNNDHYLAFEDRAYSFLTDLQMITETRSDLPLKTGAFRTRAWGKLSYDMGTNRRTIKYAFDFFLCAPIESWRLRGVPDHFVRRDVSRTIGGNPSTYQNDCRSCHALMDPIAGAFARLDFVNGANVYTPQAVAPKMNQNGEVYPPGYVTTDESWSNLLYYNTSFDFGWRTPIEGQNIQAFTTMLANSVAFSQCLVRRVYSEVCGSSIVESAPQLLTPLTQDFEIQGRNLKYLFAKVASTKECIAQ